MKTWYKIDPLFRRQYQCLSGRQRAAFRVLELELDEDSGRHTEIEAIQIIKFDELPITGLSRVFGFCGVRGVRLCRFFCFFSTAIANC